MVERADSINLSRYEARNINFDFKNKSQDLKKEKEIFIPLNSDLGKQIGRTTKEYRPDIDKYKPVYGEPDALGRREIIGYVEPNLWDLFK